METNYKTEDGHYLDYEDLTSFIKMKVGELKKDNLQSNQIFDYFADEEEPYINTIIGNIIKSDK
ncbi:hypothetical protein [uncultured Bacteroides sp.]|uniref:hypothetical protein n=1 Tax=uncultured Bacteroides sp. TaxID=162156 RepID=UPI002AAAC70C|nr:hypothetical protein [uncultured Bacteroides sp.]